MRVLSLEACVQVGSFGFTFIFLMPRTICRRLPLGLADAAADRPYSSFAVAEQMFGCQPKTSKCKPR